jgi:hypothetical protein
MSEIDRQNPGLDAATLMAAGVGAVAIGGVAFLLTRSSGASHSMEAGSAFLFGLAGAFAAVAVARRAAVTPEADNTGEPHARVDPEPGESEVLEAVKYLQETVGSKVTAYLSGAEDVCTVERWSSGEERPQPSLAGRLLYGCETVRPIVDRYDSSTANAWLFGTNPWLKDEAPAYVLRHDDRPEVWKKVVHAAQDFAEFKR